MDWEQLTQTPSRQTAEPVNREERARMLSQAKTNGVHCRLSWSPDLPIRKTIFSGPRHGMEHSQTRWGTVGAGRHLFYLDISVVEPADSLTDSLLLSYAFRHHILPILGRRPYGGVPIQKK